jgi:hypothetical protein
MINAYSQRMLPPYSGQAQIAESDLARAITMDGELWEIHFVYAANAGQSTGQRSAKRKFRRVAGIRHRQLVQMANPTSSEFEDVDERILELARFLAEASLPFPAMDNYEYWLLDPADDSPLALIFSCIQEEQMANFPALTEWTALPAAVMPIEATDEERARSDSPVNYRLERLVAERAGSKPRARWFQRRPDEQYGFPAFLVREDWQDEAHQALCQRYIDRQSSRLLMLHGLQPEERRRLEHAAKSQAAEVARFYPLYPEVVDEKVMNAIRAEARLRSSTDEQNPLLDRRDGVLYL